MNYNIIKKFRQKLKTNQATIGTWVQSASCTNAEILAKNNYDWVAIDMEHGQISWHEHENLVRTIEGCNVIPLTRISQPNIDYIKHALDSGSYGIIIPMIQKINQLEELILNSIFPPDGKRGVGYCRANNFGKDFESYIKKFTPIIIPMMENLNFFSDLKQIVKLKFIDSIFLGPYDFSASINKTGKFKNRLFNKYENEFLKILKKNNVRPGIHVVSTNFEDVKYKVKKGYKFVAYSTDAQFLSISSKINK